ncbi:IS110 family transposase [Streptomyces sp. NPDC047009]|uniref:IS110 family transposase n=1 Tax=Streptomyces sp. NPDC047009 TaxID=3154496 RepID=UPI0033D8C76C
MVITLLASHGQRPLYMPGRAVNRASGSCRGEGKTDARDALIIADQARVPRDLSPLRAADEAMAEPKLLTARRTDLVCDRTRASNRLRGLLAGIFPALERELNLAAMEPLILLTGYQTPGVIRRLGASRLQKWLRSREPAGQPCLPAPQREPLADSTPSCTDRTATTRSGPPSTRQARLSVSGGLDTRRPSSWPPEPRSLRSAPTRCSPRA